MSEPAPVEATETILALADDEMAMAHWYATWLGLGPFLEEDLAVSSIGQDELGHARALFGLLDPDGVAPPSNTGSSPLDQLAFGRAPEAYRCAWMVEQPCVLWEDLFIRHVLYDEAETIRWEALAGSSVAALAAVAQRCLAEEVFHRRHAASLLAPLLAGSQEANQRLNGALKLWLPQAVALFEPVATEAAALASGVTAATAQAQASEFRIRVDVLFGELSRGGAWPAMPSEPQGRRGRRSPHFAAMFSEMNRVFSLDPAARW